MYDWWQFVLLHHYHKKATQNQTPKSFRICFNQTNSDVVVAMAQYSASAEEREVVDCFLDFHGTKESSKNKQNPVIDLLESLHLAQLESQNPLSFREEEDDKKIH